MRPFLLLLAILFAALSAYLNRSFFHDDAFITLRYADNFIAGRGLVWNPNEYVQGYTNFLSLIFISFLGKLGLDLISASRVVNAIALMGTFLFLLLFPFSRSQNRTDSLRLLPAVFTLTSVPLIVWSLGGLEGPLFSMLVAIGCALLMRAVQTHKRSLYAASGVLHGLCFLARPDGLIFISLSIVWLFLVLYRSKKPAICDIATYALSVTSVALPYVLWQLSYYGDIVPNTFYAKTGTPSAITMHIGPRYILDYLKRPPYLPVIALAVASLAAISRRWNQNLTYLSVLVLAYAGYIVLIGGDHMPSYRLVLPTIPLLAIFIGIAVGSFHMPKNKIACSVIIGILGVAIGMQAFDAKLNPKHENPAAFFGTIVGKHIAEAWPAGSLVALNTAGSIPYYASHNVYIDMLGLNDPTIAKRKIDKIRLRWQTIPGHLKGDGAYVIQREPDYIILGPPEGTLASKPWFLSDLEIGDSTKFTDNYELHQITLNKEGNTPPFGPFVFTYYKKIDQFRIPQ